MEQRWIAAGSPARVAAPAEVDAVAEILAGAFVDDPLWSWAFPDAARRPAQLTQVWGLVVRGAMRYPGVWLNESSTAAAVWIPPGGTELSAEQEVELEDLLVDMLGPQSARALGFLAAFEAAHPRREPHFYLSLLGTDVAHRGRGYGLALLADTLRVVDSAGAPAYLEASNPVNVALYARHGFEPYGTVIMPDRSSEATTMWRAARGLPIRTR